MYMQCIYKHKLHIYIYNFICKYTYIYMYIYICITNTYTSRRNTGTDYTQDNKTHYHPVTSPI